MAVQNEWDEWDKGENASKNEKNGAYCKKGWRCESEGDDCGEGWWWPW